MRFGSLALFLFFPCLLAAQPPSSRPSVTSVEIDPMLFSATDGKVKRIEQLDLRELYKTADRFYQEKRYPLSIRLYQRILDFFPNDAHRHAATYNLALALEDNGQCDQAAPLYLRITENYKDKPDLTLNASFRAAGCYGTLKAWDKAFALYDRLLLLPLLPDDRIDAMAYAGEALFHLRQFNQARPLLRLAVSLYLQKDPSSRDIAFAPAMAQYYLARIHDETFRQRPLGARPSFLKEDLEYKASHLIAAQKLYFQTIELRHSEWAMASLYRIGQMYETIYSDIMKAPIPSDLNPEEQKLYLALLRDKIKILLDKALAMYSHNLRLAERLGLSSNDWKRRSQERFQSLLTFYKALFGTPTLLPSSAPASQPSSRPAPLPHR